MAARRPPRARPEAAQYLNARQACAPGTHGYWVFNLAVEITTGRGLYRIIEAAPADLGANAIVLTIALARADGIERVVFRCRIDMALAGASTPDDLIARLRPWVEREFEMTREAALKSIRSERKLHEIVFDNANRGPL